MIFIIFLVSFITQIFFLHFIVGAFARHSHQRSSSPQVKGVSVIVAIRNEKNNIVRLLEGLVKQQYEDYEVILVDDRSSDGTSEMLQYYKNKFSFIKVIRIETLESNISPKKNALTYGILAAKKPIILLTDADCAPISNQWVRSMTTLMKDNFEVCLGYGKYQKLPGLLNLIIRFETFYTAIQYFSLALKGHPYMGVGRNLAYTRELFIRNKGFESHFHVLSGDDDLLAKETFVKSNTTIEYSIESQTLSVPKTTYRSWLIQKTRHLSAGLQYKWQTKLILGGLFFTQFAFCITSAVLIALDEKIEIVIIGYIFRTLLIILFYSKISKKLNEDFNWYLFPILELLYILNHILVSLNTIFSKKIKWT